MKRLNSVNCIDLPGIKYCIMNKEFAQRPSRPGGATFGYGYKSVKEIMSLQKEQMQYKVSRTITKETKSKEKEKSLKEYKSILNNILKISYNTTSFSPNEVLWLLLCFPNTREKYNVKNNSSSPKDKPGILLNIPNTLIIGIQDQPILLKTNTTGFLQRIINPSEKDIHKLFGGMGVTNTEKSTVFVPIENKDPLIICDANTPVHFQGRYESSINFAELKHDLNNLKKDSNPQKHINYHIQNIPVAKLRSDGRRSILRVFYNLNGESSVWKIIFKEVISPEETNKLETQKNTIHTLMDDIDKKWTDFERKLLKKDVLPRDPEDRYAGDGLLEAMTNHNRVLMKDYVRQEIRSSNKYENIQKRPQSASGRFISSSSSKSTPTNQKTTKATVASGQKGPSTSPITSQMKKSIITGVDIRATAETFLSNDQLNTTDEMTSYLKTDPNGAGDRAKGPLELDRSHITEQYASAGSNDNINIQLRNDWSFSQRRASLVSSTDKPSVVRREREKRLINLSDTSPYFMERVDEIHAHAPILQLRSVVDHLERLTKREVLHLAADFIYDTNNKLILTDFLGIEFYQPEDLNKSRMTPLAIPIHIRDALENIYGCSIYTVESNHIRRLSNPLNDINISLLNGDSFQSCHLCHKHNLLEQESNFIDEQIVRCSVLHLKSRLSKSIWPSFCHEQRFSDVSEYYQYNTGFNDDINQETGPSLQAQDSFEMRVSQKRLCDLCHQIVIDEASLIRVENGIKQLILTNTKEIEAVPPVHHQPLAASTNTLFSSSKKTDWSRSAGPSSAIGQSSVSPMLHTTAQRPGLLKMESTGSVSLTSTSPKRNISPEKSRQKNDITTGTNSGSTSASSTLNFKQRSNSSISKPLKKAKSGENFLPRNIPTGTVLSTDEVLDSKRVTLSRVLIALFEIDNFPVEILDEFKDFQITYKCFGKEIQSLRLPKTSNTSQEKQQEDANGGGTSLPEKPSMSLDIRSLQISHVITSGDGMSDERMTDHEPCSLGRFICCHRSVLVTLVATPLHKEHPENGGVVKRSKRTHQGDYIRKNVLALCHITLKDFLDSSGPLKRNYTLPFHTVNGNQFRQTFYLKCAVGLHRLLYPVERKSLPSTLRHLGPLGQALVPLHEADIIYYQRMPDEWVQLEGEETPDKVKEDQPRSRSDLKSYDVNIISSIRRGSGRRNEAKSAGLEKVPYYIPKLFMSTQDSRDDIGIWCLAIRIEDACDLNHGIGAPMSPWPWICEYEVLGDHIVLDSIEVTSQNKRESVCFCSTSKHLWQGREGDLDRVISYVDSIWFRVRGVDESSTLTESKELMRLLDHERFVLKAEDVEVIHKKRNKSIARLGDRTKISHDADKPTDLTRVLSGLPESNSSKRRSQPSSLSVNASDEIFRIIEAVGQEQEQEEKEYNSRILNERNSKDDTNLIMTGRDFDDEFHENNNPSPLSKKRSSRKKYSKTKKQNQMSPHDVVFQGKLQLKDEFLSRRLVIEKLDLQLDHSLRNPLETEGNEERIHPFINVVMELYRLRPQEELEITEMNSESVHSVEIMSGIRKIDFADRISKQWSSVLGSAVRSGLDLAER